MVKNKYDLLFLGDASEMLVMPPKYEIPWSNAPFWVGHLVAGEGVRVADDTQTSASALLLGFHAIVGMEPRMELPPGADLVRGGEQVTHKQVIFGTFSFIS